MSKSTLSEADFQRAVIDMAELHQWRIYHVAKVKGQLRSETSKGFPDLVLARYGSLVFAELKREGEEPTHEQKIWLAFLRSAHPHVYVWRPPTGGRSKRSCGDRSVIARRLPGRIEKLIGQPIIVFPREVQIARLPVHPEHFPCRR